MRLFLSALIVFLPAPLFAEVFLRDAETELIIEDLSDGSKSFELRREGTPEQGTLASVSGTLEQAGAAWKVKRENKKSPNATFTPAENGRWEVKFSGGDDFTGSYKKITDAEQLKRAKLRYEAIDATLNREYQALRSRLGEGEKKELRDEQRKWIEYRDTISEDQPRQVGEGDVPVSSAPSYWSSMEDLTRQRVEFLRAWSREGLSAEIDGTYSDCYGGHMVLERREAGIKFQISVVRGPTSHLGDIDGVAKRKGDLARYQDRENPPAKLELKFLGNRRVQVTGENTSYYHGARAYFDGLYLKISDKVEFESN